jgi:class 3 adenylate cyclase
MARAEVAGVEVEHEGMALTELGELYRYRGEVALARQAFEGAHEKGWPPQPGLSLLRLRTGDVDGALRMIGRVVDWSSGEPAALVHLLPAQVEIAIAAGENTVVEAAATRLAAVASALGSSTAAAASACVAGLMLQQRGDLTAAAHQFELSVRSWRQARSPYDAAQTQMRLADVFIELGDPNSAELELAAARKTFERLGAAPEARRAARRLGDDTPNRASLTFMFTDVVNSTSLLSVMGDEAWDGVLRWHDRTVSAIVGEHRGKIVKGTGDGFFIVFDEPAFAVDAAMAVQRALDAHRRAEGFAPAVRIGLHAGSAISADEDYAGQDVVVAARISALAGADEILVSRAVADRLGPHVALVEHRTAQLKGIPDPVEIDAVDWR